jgi:hypothetical protein
MLLRMRPNRKEKNACNSRKAREVTRRADRATSGRCDCASIDSCPRERAALAFARCRVAADAVGAMAGLASAAATGDVTADEAAKLAKVISLYVNTLEAHHFEDRLAKLERVDLKRVAYARNYMQSAIMPKAAP